MLDALELVQYCASGEVDSDMAMQSWRALRLNDRPIFQKSVQRELRRSIGDKSIPAHVFLHHRWLKQGFQQPPDSTLGHWELTSLQVSRKRCTR